ncbi:pentapeptide repeat-containing protein [Lentzea rhizosphaerae]|uniref:Pentapeptide repeat-containing protein n=1 Tax=Lentzea rhizosphaerae TaxID=2041025 RepID=A0ABV8C0W3_9PSEU
MPFAVVALVLAGSWALKSRRGETMQALTGRSILVGSVVVLGIGVTAAVLLIRHYGGGSASQQLDVIRTAGTIVVGTGGAVALLLTARRQRYTELTLAHQREVAISTEFDATERRITELYTKAADQLGSEKAAVRLAGLYALERLGESSPGQRQTIINLLCAYLRMPYEYPAEDEPKRDAVEEEHVRRAVVRVIGRHSIAGNDEYWRVPQIDLSGAALRKAELAEVDFRLAKLSGADLAGANLSQANLRGADLTGANLAGARMSMADLVAADLTDADLSNASLFWARLAPANLNGARLVEAELRHADLRGAALLRAVLDRAAMSNAKLSRAGLLGASLVAVVARNADLSGVVARDVDFTDATLTGAKVADADFTGAKFDGANLVGVDLMSATGVPPDQRQP